MLAQSVASGYVRAGLVTRPAMIRRCAVDAAQIRRAREQRPINGASRTLRSPALFASPDTLRSVPEVQSGAEESIASGYDRAGLSG